MQTYSIKEISKCFHLSASALRYYEEIGLLKNVQRTPNHQRIYTDEHIGRLYSIACFKNTGLPISKMLDFFHYEENITEHIDDIISLVSEHESHIQEEILKMQTDLLHIQQKVRFYHGIKDAINSGKEWPCWGDYSRES